MRLFAMVAVLSFASVAMADGKLDQVREAVNPSSSSDSRREDDKASDNCPESSATPVPYVEPYDDDDTMSFDVFAAMIGAPWIAPHAMIDPGMKVPGKFAPYPYAAADTPHVLLDRQDYPVDGRPLFRDRADVDWYCVRASIEAGSDFDGVDRVGMRLFLDTDMRIGLKSDWDYYSERLDCGCHDELWIGDLTATYRFVQHEHIQMHTGLGARFLIDGGSDHAGINFLYGFDAFPVEPIHLFGSFEAGTLGSAGVWRVRGGIGANWTHAELFAGYDYMNIGGVPLHGPFVGLRLWF